MDSISPTTWNPFKKDFWLASVPPEQYSETVADNTVDPGPSPSGPLPGVMPVHSRGEAFDARTALTIGAVYTAVGLIKAGVSQLPVSVQRNGKDVTVPAFVAKPDVYSTQTQFLSLTAGELATYGNAFWRVHRERDANGVEDQFGKVQSIEVLNYELVAIDSDKSGNRIYRYKNDVTFADWQVKHLMIFPQFERSSGLVMGLGPIQANRRELRGILQRTEWLSDFYRNGAMPKGLLSTAQPLAPGVAEDQASRFDGQVSNHRTVVLSNGITYQPIQLDPEKLMYHASAQKDTVDVARFYRMPDRYLLAAVDGSSMTYTNMEQVDKYFVTYTLTEYLIAIEDAFSELLPRGQRAKFNIDAFLRGSTSDRYAAHNVAAGGPFMTVNEVRALEDLEPVPGGDALAKPVSPVPNSNEGVSNDNTE